MPDNINVPGGAVPPKPAEAAKVQPKKETVRINLPPKPTSAPTIKLPTLAPGAPMPSATSAAAPVAASAAAPRAASAAPPPPVPPASPASRASAPASTKLPAPAAPTRPAPARGPALVGVGKLDLGLAIAAAVFALTAIGSTLWLVLGGIPGITPQ